MKFVRLEIRNFRGVERAAVDFEPAGVTIISGPNEVGKSSLAEAIDLLFDYADSSRAQAVRAVSPVHRDAGTEVVLEFRAGPYHATYLKGFNRDTRTELTVHAPAHESLTGREAHDRATEILEESVDLALWKALRMQQDTPLAYPELDGHGSLARALDRAAGEAQAGEVEHALFDVVQGEYERFWTLRSGRERAPLGEAAELVRKHREALETFQAKLRAVEDDVAESARLERAIADEERAMVELRRLEGEHGEARRRVEQLERAVEGLRAATRLARSTLAESALHLENRKALVDRIERARSDDASLAEIVARRRPELERLQADEAEARKALEEARSSARAATRAQEQAAADLLYRREELEHQQLSERRNRVQKAAEAARAAEEVVAGIQVDPKQLEAIREAHLEVERARAAAEAGSPLLRIEALRSVEVEIDADFPGPAAETLVGGAQRELRVHHATEVRIGDVARIRVEPAAESRSVQDRLAARIGAYETLLAGAGVADLAGAIRADRARTDAERQLAERDRVFRDDLRDLTAAELEHKVNRLAERVAAYPETRAAVGEGGAGGGPIPPDFDAAQEVERRAKDIAAAAARAQVEAEAAHHDVQERMRALEGELGAERGRAEQRALQIAADAEALAEARETCDDRALEEADAAATDALVRAERAEGESLRELEAASPDRVRTQAENAAQAVKRAEERARADRERQLTIRGRLEAAGREGLAERVAAEEVALTRAERAHAAVRRRADAARLLFETLRTERDRARRRYVRPLTEQIEKLGRYVFGADFSVELGEDLSVVQRTVRGRTVPFESLSGGAREQLSILARLACALVVAKDGGVPLLFDDALGNSDATRLEALGAVLALAGQQSQVVVLTCAPERYRHVGSAVVHPLSPRGEGAGEPSIAPEARPDRRSEDEAVGA